MENVPIVLEMKNISKQFPGVLANDNICIQVRKGEVYTLLGENGAGKSTLMNILSGLYKPTSGEIYVDGVRQKFHSAKDAMNIGIGMVHQHFMLIPRMSVIENCLIGYENPEKYKLDLQSASEKIMRIASQFHMNIDPNETIEHLSVGQRQRVEIIKALFRGAKILILDEPTSVLTPQEATDLFKMIRKLTDEDYTVIFISHKLNEVMEISDRVTVLKTGRLVGTFDVTDCSIHMLAREMVGREVEFDIDKKASQQKEVVLSVSELTLLHENNPNVKILDNVCFEVHKGEIIGIAGVDGNGQTELADCLTGLRKVNSGRAMFKDVDLFTCATREIMANGVSHIPQDRQSSGLVLSMNLTENLILQDYYKNSFGKNIFLNWENANRYSEELIADYGIKTPGRFELAQNLSGGNQQKVILAREISRMPELLIAMHPTRGLDVGAIEYIHRKIIENRNQGLAILLVSTELEEVLQLSDRICVLFEGKIMGIIEPDEVSIEQIGLMMGGMKLSSICQG